MSNAIFGNLLLFDSEICYNEENIIYGGANMQQDEVFFIGLGKGGSTIVNELKKRAYRGIMIDCSVNNMKFLKMQQEEDYYLLGGTGGTAGERKTGRAYIEKELSHIQPVLENLCSVREVIIIACADSGVVGGQEVIVKEINKYAHGCKINFLSILPSQYCFGQLKEMVEECSQNIEFKKQGIISNHVYVKCEMEDRLTGIDDRIVKALDNLFENDYWTDKMSDSTLVEFVKNTNNRFLIVGEERNQLIQELRDKLLQKGLDFCNSYMKEVAKSIEASRVKQKEMEEHWKKHLVLPEKSWKIIGLIGI